MGVGGFWTDPEVWVFLFPVFSGLENNCNPPPIIAENPPDFIAYLWIFVFADDIISSTLLVMV